MTHPTESPFEQPEPPIFTQSTGASDPMGYIQAECACGWLSPKVANYSNIQHSEMRRLIQQHKDEHPSPAPGGDPCPFCSGRGGTGEDWCVMCNASGMAARTHLYLQYQKKFPQPPAPYYIWLGAWQAAKDFYFPAPAGGRPPIGWRGWYTSREALDKPTAARWWRCQVLAYDEGEPVIKTKKGHYHRRPFAEYSFCSKLPEGASHD